MLDIAPEAAAAGVAAWLLTSLFKRNAWPTEVKTALAVVVAAVTALAVVVGTALWAGDPVSLANWRDTAVAAFALGQAIYGLLAVRVPGIATVDQALTRFAVPASDQQPPADPAAV